MLGMEQLHHAQVHFATAAEALFKQSMRTKIHIRPRQSAEGLPFFNVIGERCREWALLKS
jgi:hypothetical protein